MKQDRAQRRAEQLKTRRKSSASAILSKKSSRPVTGRVDYFSPDWLLLFGTFLTITLISFLFTPFTHQLDEIKNVLLMLLPPFLLGVVIWRMDFSGITWKRNGALILLGLYFAWMWISWLVNPFKMMGERVIWFNVGVSTFTLVFAWCMNSENKVRKTMVFFVSLALVSTILGLFLYAGRYTQGMYATMLSSDYWQAESRQMWANLVYTLTSSHGDMYSFILNPDFYAAFLVMLIPLSLSMFFVEQRTGYKILALTSVLAMNLCLFLTNSNDSFIAMFLLAYPFYFIVGGLYVKQWGLSRRFVLSFCACSAVLLVFIAILMLPKLSATFDFKTAAFEGRRVLWGGGFWPWIYGDNHTGKGPDFISIIFGTGPGGYRHYFPWFRRPDFFDQQINNVTTFSHNFYLDVLLETGLVGLILFIGFHVRVFADGFRQIRFTESRTNRLYQLAVLTGMVGIAVQNFSSPNNRWAVAGVIYCCLFGLSMGLVAVEDPPVPGENADKKLAGIPIYKISKWACLLLAGLFFLRCVAPGAQFYDYWRGATENAEGLRDMEYSSYRSLSEEQRLALLVESIDHYEKAIKHNPTFSTSYYKLGHAYNQLGQFTNDPTYAKRAIEVYETLNRINDSYSEVQLNLGIMYAQRAGNYAQDRQHLDERAAQLKQDLQGASGARAAELEMDLAQLQEEIASLGNPEEWQVEHLEKSYGHMKSAAHQSLKPNTQYLAGTIGRELANAYERTGELEKADEIKEEIKKYFRSLLTYKPKLAELQLDQQEFYEKSKRSLLTLAEETGKIEETIDILKRMVHDDPDNDLMIRALLETYDRGDMAQEKLEFLQDAVHADPTDAGLRLSLAETYKDLGDMEKYINELRRAEVLVPDDTDLLVELQAAYETAGNEAKVAEYATKLAERGVVTTTTEAVSEGVTTGSAELSETDGGTTGTAADAITTEPELVEELPAPVEVDPGATGTVVLPGAE